MKRRYESKQMLALLKVDSNYQSLIREKGQLITQLNEFNPQILVAERTAASDRLHQLEAQEVELSGRVQEFKEKGKEILRISVAQPTVTASASASTRPTTPASKPTAAVNQTIVVEWGNIRFGNGSFLAKHHGVMLNSCPIPESRISLNAIKAHYKFRNAPLLKLVINGRNIIQVLNREVILFYIQLLTDTGSYLEPESDIRPLSISRFAAFNRQYYQNHLPNLFQSSCLKYLCRLTDAKASIIPVPELVINSKGSRSIDDSFLFPIKDRGQYYIAWESVEESKATYLFQASADNLLKTLQTIYDYLVGPTVNKRTQLIGSPVIQSQTGFLTRIKHTFFIEWKIEIHARCQIQSRVSTSKG